MALLDYTLSKSRLWLASLLCLAGCASQPVVTELAPELSLPLDKTPFLPQVAVPSETEIFQLSQHQQAEFEAFLQNRWHRDVPRYQLVFDYLAQSTERFNYQAKTFVASQTLGELTGNCMSLAVLTTALAEYAGVDVRYQLMTSAPVFYKEKDVVVKGVHVRSKLYQRPEKDKIYTGGSSLIVDYLPDDRSRFVGNISHEQFMALYYGNRAVELMNNQDLKAAFWHAEAALTYYPKDSSALNTLALLYARVGDAQLAERVYRYGIEIADNRLTLLKNLRGLLERQGRDNDANEISRKIASYSDPSPFGWIEAANLAFDDGDLREAELFYRKSIEAAPYLDYGYFGLARVDYQLGAFDDAKEHLEKALENAFRASERELYEAKLAVLQQEMND